MTVGRSRRPAPAATWSRRRARSTATAASSSPPPAPARPGCRSRPTTPATRGRARARSPLPRSWSSQPEPEPSRARSPPAPDDAHADDAPDGSALNGSRQSALSTTREPRIPAKHVLDRVHGRVLNPSHRALRRRAWARGPPCTSGRGCWSPGPTAPTTDPVLAGSRTARLGGHPRRLGWTMRGSSHGRSRRGGRDEPAGSAGLQARPCGTCRRSSRAEPDEKVDERPSATWSASTSGVRNETAPPSRRTAGWCSRTPGPRPRVAAMDGVGLDHVVLVRRHRLEPVPHLATRSTPPTRSTPRTRSPATPPSAGGGRQPVAYVGPPPAAAQARRARRGGVRWWRCSTPAAASTRGWTGWSSAT